jgi:hypothetical protein
MGGNIPLELGNLSNLGYLYLSNNRLSGIISRELSKLLSIEDSYLDGKPIERKYPPRLGNIFILSVNNNRLSGNIPDFISENLWILLLNNNELSGNIPPSLENLKIILFKLKQ